MEAIGLDNREAIAVVFVTALVVVLAVWRGTRGIIGSMVRTVLSGSMGCMILGFTFVAGGLVAAAYFTGWWRLSLLTATALWFVGLLRLVLRDTGSLSSGDMRFRSIFARILSGPTIFTFVAGIYTYPLAVELGLGVLVLVASAFGATASVVPPEQKAIGNCIARVASVVIVAVALATTVRVIVGLVNESAEVDWWGVLQEFLLPVAFTLIAAPAVYGAAVWANVEFAATHLGWKVPPQRRRRGIRALLLESRGRLSLLTRRSTPERIQCYDAMREAPTTGEARAVFRERMGRRP